MTSGKPPELSPGAQELAVVIADRVAGQLYPRLRDLVDRSLADWAPLCTCASPLPIEDPVQPRCGNCGRRTT